jgi:predicted nucleotide-binding protein
VLVQGQNQAQVRAALGLGGGGAPKKTPVSRKVFVVYGHDATARTELEAMLRRWGLDPIILDQLPSEGGTLIEKLIKYMSDDEVRFAIVLATPDDEGYPRGKPDEKRYRARQNVVLELGILLNLLGRARVAILLKDQANMERPSDIQGLVYLPFTENVEDAKVNLAKEMQAQGIDIHVAKL